MAIKKEIILENGLTVKYFKIVGINQGFNDLGNVMGICIHGYADTSYREQEQESSDVTFSKCILIKDYQLPIDDSKGYSRADIYKRILLEIPEFADAIEA